MLKRRLAQLLTVALVATGLVVLTEQAAQADYIYCPPNNGPCVIVVSSGGGGSGGGGGGGSGGSGGLCLHESLGWISCYKSGLGWFNPNDSCYYLRLNLPISDPAWGGNDPNNGDMYSVYCWGGGSAGWVLVDTVYRTSAPPGYGGGPSTLDIAVRAINLLPITKPAIETAPKHNGAGLVGLPLWMWTRTKDSSGDPLGTWGTFTSPRVSAGGITVQARATSTQIKWAMGNGITKTCKNPGSAYDPNTGTAPTPNCGYANGYSKSSRSQKNGVYTITATTTWSVHWWANTGESGDVTVYRSSTSTLLIQEMQVVTR